MPDAPKISVDIVKDRDMWHLIVNTEPLTYTQIVSDVRLNRVNNPSEIIRAMCHAVGSDFADHVYDAILAKMLEERKPE